MVSATCQNVLHQEWRLDFNRFLNWKMLLRVTDWVKRLIQNSKSVKNQKKCRKAEMADAEFAQSSLHKENIKIFYMKIF